MARAWRIVDDHSFAALELVLSAETDGKLEACAKQLNAWWQAPAFEAEAKRWQKEAKAAIDDWYQRASETLERTLALPDLEPIAIQASVRADALPFGSATISVVEPLTRLIAPPFQHVGRDAVYQVAKRLGFNFRPWQAVRLATRFAQVGRVLGVVGAILQIVTEIKTIRDERKREEERRRLAAEVRRTADEVHRLLTLGEDEGTATKPDAPIAGPLRYLQVLSDELGAIEREVKYRLDALEAERRAVEDRLNTYRSLMDDAWACLGLSEGKGA